MKYRNQVLTLAAEHGQPEDLAKLLPISVDGLLVVASIVMTEDREAGRPARPWARASFVIGVVASVAANIAAAPEDAISRLISAWPAVALLLVVEHVRRTVHGQAAEAIVSLLPERQQASEETGS
ncbi:MAG TPA: DUF2637 domain-containing protein [Micromonosporaceae bacterium]